MEPVKFAGAKWIGKPKDMTDEQCNGIWAMTGKEEEFRFFLECWQPNSEDRAAIAAGGPVWLKIMASGLPPISVFTHNEAGESNGAFNALSDAVKTVVKNLKEDEGYFIGWKANIAMCFYDEYVKTYPNSKKEIHALSNIAAHKFLNLLTQSELFPAKNEGIPNTKHTSTCLLKAADDEPIFTLRAKDPFAPEIVLEWAKRNEGIQPPEKLEQAMGIAAEMDAWRIAHPVK